MSEVENLINEIKSSRQEILELVRHLSTEQGEYKPSSQRWSVVEILEHLVLAEQGGINFIWKAADGYKKGLFFWEGDSINHGLSIEQIVERTWKPKEHAPESALPRLKGPVQYWIAALDACQPVLEKLGDELNGFELDKIIYPHFLSGPLDARQRLEFLPFHLQRHLKQINVILADKGFPDKIAVLR